MSGIYLCKMDDGGTQIIVAGPQVDTERSAGVTDIVGENEALIQLPEDVWAGVAQAYLQMNPGVQAQIAASFIKGSPDVQKAMAISYLAEHPEVILVAARANRGLAEKITSEFIESELHLGLD
jgi:hypothetical protein